MDNTIIQQGTFTSNGEARVITLRSGIDWFEVYNYTKLGSNGNPGVMQRAYWQSDMGNGVGVSVKNTNGAATLEYAALASPTGFSLYDSQTATVGGAIAVTAGTNATQPVYSTANTSTLLAGGIVRVTGSAHTNLNGLDFSVDTVVANTSFRLANAIATAPGVIAGANGYWRLVSPDLALYKLFYPGKRYLANITQAANAVVTTLVDHDYEVGTVVRFKVSSEYGMSEIDGLTATVTAVTDSTFTIDLDTTGYSAFQFPLPARVPFDHATVVPVGGDQTETYDLDALGLNRGIIAMNLGSAVCGANNDVIYWRAGKVFNK